MKKEEAIRIIVNCAKEFQANLENKNLLFIFENKPHIEYLETVFLATNYLHLTGVEINKAYINGSGHFYQKCLNGRLSPKDFELCQNGTTEMKLNILPQLMQIHKSARMLGDYNFSKSVLYTEKLAGTISACMGFVLTNTSYFVPNTALMEDIRNVSNRPVHRILAILRKPIQEREYSEVCHTAKEMDGKQLYNKVYKPCVLQATAATQKVGLTLSHQSAAKSTVLVERESLNSRLARATQKQEAYEAEREGAPKRSRDDGLER